MVDKKYYFGHDIYQRLEEWLDGPFNDELTTKYGTDTAYAAVIFVNFSRMSSNSTTDNVGEVICRYGHGPVEMLEGHEGLFQNVRRKLSFYYRTGLPSSEARRYPELVEQGDFPFEGAGEYRGFTGGVSGFHEESDWWVFKQIVDKLIELRAAVGAEAIAASARQKPGMKYLGGYDWELVQDLD